jgi:hypothetical protein
VRRAVAMWFARCAGFAAEHRSIGPNTPTGQVKTP